MKNFLRRLRAVINRNSKFHYLLACRRGAIVLDVGCGNGSPAKFEGLRHDIEYHGIDVVSSRSGGAVPLFGQFEFSSPARFHELIDRRKNFFDLIVSAHNIEHCDHPDRVFDAICAAVKENGIVFFSFPSEASTRFPSRTGTLNFYDDATHRTVPDFSGMERKLMARNFDILVSAPRARFWPEVIVGLCTEPLSALARRTLPGTWALWGFESVLVGRRRASGSVSAVVATDAIVSLTSTAPVREDS